MERTFLDLTPDPARLARYMRLVQSYVHEEDGSRSALVQAAQEDPEAMTVSLVAVGMVLLDLASAPLELDPLVLLDRLSDEIVQTATDVAVAPAL